jgi:hypothetical protein
MTVLVMPPAKAQDDCQAFRNYAQEIADKVKITNNLVKAYGEAVKQTEEQVEALRLTYIFAAAVYVDAQDKYLDPDASREDKQAYYDAHDKVFAALDKYNAANDAIQSAAKNGQTALMALVIWKAAAANAEHNYEQCVKAAATPVCQITGGRWHLGETAHRDMLVSSNHGCRDTISADANTTIDSVDVSSAGNGSVSVDGLSFVYQSNDGYHGSDSFTVTIQAHTEKHPDGDTAYLDFDVEVQ